MRTVSYVLLCVEAVVLAIPTLFGLIMGIKLLAAAMTGGLPSDDIPLGMMFLCMLGLLVVGWHMLCQRLANGPLALRAVSRLWWVAAGLGGIVAVCGYALLRTDSRLAMFSMAIYGVPTLIHLALETWVWPPKQRLERP